MSEAADRQPAGEGAGERTGAEVIRLLLADVDGTLVTPEKRLTERAIAAVRRLRQAGIIFAITSGRPPRGMAMLIEPLAIETPIAAFNGGVIIEPDMRVLEQHTVPARLVEPIVRTMGSFGLDAWIYRGSDWYVRDLEGPHVERESRTVGFGPEVMTGLDGLTSDVAKIVGVSDDHEAVARATRAIHDELGDDVAASASQPYYLDVTHPAANKGTVARYLADRYEISERQIATIGDMPNDVLMFARSGLSIAMGNADREVKRAARRVTDGNDAEGFANAIERLVLPRAPAPHASAATLTGLDGPERSTVST